VLNFGEGEKKLIPEKMMLAKGTARMNGVRRSVDGVGGRELAPGVGWSKGTTENCVRRRARPIASGNESRSSRPSDGCEGRRLMSGVRV
jgi:hypothetical protein